MKKYFDGITKLDELRKAYKKWAMELHPDHGGTNEEFRSMADEYHRMIPLMKNHDGETVNDTENVKVSAEAEKFKEIIDILLNLDGVEVELCGNWLWISGDTRQYKDRLKALGCRWAPKKTKWYWMPEEERHARHYRGKSTMAEIRNKYGSTRFVKGDDNKKAITA